MAQRLCLSYRRETGDTRTSFMGILLSFILPALLLLAPIIFQVTYTVLYILHKTKLPPGRSLALAILVGGIFPFIAMLVCMHGINYNLPADGPHCVTGVQLIIPLGFALLLVVCPLVYLSGTVIHGFRIRRKNE
jgi:hypothetical protein